MDLAEWRKGGEHARRVTPQGYFGAPSPRDPFLWRFHQRMAARHGRSRERVPVILGPGRSMR